MSTVVRNMTSTLARTTALLGAVLVAAGCAAQPGTGAAPSSSAPAEQDDVSLPDDGAPVLQIAYTGGFVTPQTTFTQLPLVSVHADGRVFTQGPVAAIYPGPALPNVLVTQIDRARVAELVQQALDAGVGDDVDYGMPPVADVPSTLFTVVTGEGTQTTEVYALQPGLFPEGEAIPGLSDEQIAARAALQELLDQATAAAVGSEQPYDADAVAAVVSEWVAAPDMPAPADVAWPGPPLPGEPLDEGLGLSCVTARGEAADAVIEAAATANANTPWTDADGNRWSLVLRPLLPHETGCADLPQV